MRPIRFLLALSFVVALGSIFAPSADAVLFPRLAIRRQAVVVQPHAVVAQPLVLRQRFVAPVVVPHVQQFVVPQVQQFRLQQFVAPLGVQSGCGAFLVR